MTIVKFLFGTFLLVQGAEWLVDGAQTIAKRLKIPAHVVGLTLVALGTSAPELFVNVLAACHGKSDFALANASGSNLANLAVGFGLCAILAGTRIRKADFASDLTLLWIAPVVVVTLLWANGDSLPMFAMIPFSAILVYYLWSLKGRGPEQDESPESGPVKNVWRGVGWFLLGIVALFFGGEFVLHSAISVAESLGIGADVIALTVVAFGTSIPDITTSVIAAKRGEHGIATGNLLGSNISNIVVVLNATLLAGGGALAASKAIRMDYVAVFVLSLLIVVVASRKECVPKWCGWLMIGLYVTYLTIRVWF